jgi:hypothetical protein
MGAADMSAHRGCYACAGQPLKRISAQGRLTGPGPGPGPGGGGIHPNHAGYAAMASAFNVALLRCPRERQTDEHPGGRRPVLLG